MTKNYRLEYPFVIPPIYCVGVTEDIQDEFELIKDKLNFNYIDDSLLLKNTHQISNKFNDNILEKLNMDIMLKTIDENVKNYCKELNYPYRKYKLQSWFTLNLNGDYSQKHHHGNQDISGCYYYQTNGEDGEILFINPVEELSLNDLYRNYTNFSWYHIPQVGKLMLFPSFMEHCVNRNVTDSHRISMSFNVKFIEN
jgi:uncharacterized protein (TIGR02466 family)